MPDAAHLIFVRPATPPAAVAVRVAWGAPAAAAAEEGRAALRAAGHTGQAVVLALPSSACLCASILSHDLPAKERRRAMLYRLEEKVPLSAEEVVADFIPTSEGSLGVCAARTVLAPLVEALEAAGVPVAAVCPTSLLALQHRLRRGVATGHAGSFGPGFRNPVGVTKPPPGSRGLATAVGAAVDAAGGTARDAGETPPDAYDAAVLTRDGQVELVFLDGGSPCAWSILSDQPKELSLHLKLESFNGRAAPQHLLAIGLAAPALAALAGSGARVTEAAPAAAGDEAAAMGGQVLAGRAHPWVDLRGGLGARDRLRPVRVPLRFAAAAVSACLLNACAAMLWRATRYDRLAGRYADEQREVFRQTFPRQPEPEDVRSRLASEERGLRGLSGDPSAPPPQPPGLIALRDLLARLPDGVRFRLLELRLDGTQFTLEGQARSHGDADAIASALRAAPGFAVEPPRTEQLSGGAAPPAPAPAAEGASAGPAAGEAGGNVVAFTITGSVAAPALPDAVATGGLAR